MSYLNVIMIFKYINYLHYHYYHYYLFRHHYYNHHYRHCYLHHHYYYHLLVISSSSSSSFLYVGKKILIIYLKLNLGDPSKPPLCLSNKDGFQEVMWDLLTGTSYRLSTCCHKHYHYLYHHLYYLHHDLYHHH